MKEENKHLFTQEPDAPDNDSSSDSAVNNTPKKPTPNTYKFRPTAARAVPQAKVYKVGDVYKRQALASASRYAGFAYFLAPAET